MTTSKIGASTVALVSTVLTLSLVPAQAQEKSRYMGADVPLAEAPNGAVINAQALEATSRIIYTEPTTEKLTDGVWCIGGLSIANTTVIEGGDRIRPLRQVRPGQELHDAAAPRLITDVEPNL